MLNKGQSTASSYKSLNAHWDQIHSPVRNPNVAISIGTFCANDADSIPIAVRTPPIIDTKRHPQKLTKPPTSGPANKVTRRKSIIDSS